MAFRAMGQQVLIPLLKSCTQLSEITQIHAQMIKVGFDVAPFPLSKLLASSILDIDYASLIFDRIHNPNLFMFNTMLRGYSISEKPKQALIVFSTLRAQGILMDQFSFTCTLKSCARSFAVGAGRAVHALVVQFGFEFYINVRNTLLHFYCFCERIGDAHQLFDELLQERDLVSWNALIGGYLQISQPFEVMCLFRQMHTSGVEVSNVTVLNVLSACGESRDLSGGEALHGHCIKKGFCCELNVASAIIGMYSKNRDMDSARQLFDGISKKDVVSWNCVIEGYAKNGFIDESLSLLKAMKLEQVKPNTATLIGLLSACASSGALTKGLSIHRYIEEESLNIDVVLGTTLIDMYSKCGLLEKAVGVFDKMHSKDVKTWSAMIAGYGLNGQGRNALQLFDRIEEEGVMPNEVVILAVLNACSHNGLVLEGKNFFEKMIRVYGFSPSIEHYGCMIDLLGRAGLLEEAYELIKSLPVERDTTTWRALLAACRVYENAELGETVRQALVELNDEHPTDVILLSGSYASLGRWDDIVRVRWDDIVRVREPRKEKLENKKEVGCSSVDIDN